MENLSYSQIQEILDKDIPRGTQKLSITVLRNIVIEPIEPYLRYFIYRMGFDAEVRFGEYDNIFQEAVAGKENLLNKNTDFVIVFMDLDTVSWNLARNFSRLSKEEVRDEIERIESQVLSILNGLRRQTDAVILWHGFPVPAYPAYGIYDTQEDSGQLAAIHKLNTCLRHVLGSVQNAYFVDMSLCVNRIGSKNFYDKRYWHMARAPYSRTALEEIAFEDSKFIRSLKGKTKKCLVLDCDDVLWGGIIGEDELSGIKLGKTYPGSAYYEFQQEIVNMHNRGILIALCSKNNAADVWDVFKNHPDMVLKEEHISAYQINWLDKATNLRRIAADLNIGLDSIVFADNSGFEVNLVKELLPEVDVLYLPKESASEYCEILISCGYFETLTISEEDKNRTAMYKTEAIRKELKTQVADINHYLQSLEMKAEINFADNFVIPRLAQQTQKTNQFNLTTRRYSDSDIKDFCNSKEADVIYMKLSDKLGDLGIIGTCILRYNKKEAILDTFLISCRALSRGAEEVFLYHALKLAKKRGCETIVGEYCATSKNDQVKDFYSKHGFEKIDDKKNDKAQRLRLSLAGDFTFSQPDYFKEIVSDF